MMATGKRSAMSRRKFIKMAASGIGLGVAAGGLPARAWMNSGRSVGVQLYTLRKLMAESVPKTLQLVSGIGYREVELAGLFGESPENFRRMLDGEGLKAPSSHVPLEILEENFSAVLEAAVTLGHKFLVLPYLQENRRKALDDYKSLAQKMNHWGEACHKAGLKFAYHNHAFEFEVIDNKIPYDILVTQTDPNYVFLEMDLYWMAKAKQDPLSYFNAYPGRFPLWHIKDMNLDGDITDVGEGIINFSKIFSAERLSGLEHGFIEHDNTSDPEGTLRTGYKTVKSI